jgi:undecaprenyl-diphosphatase
VEKPPDNGILGAPRRFPIQLSKGARKTMGDIVNALILGVVEGITEFLPISSTGHLILAGDLLGFNDERAKVFEIVIQTGAMLAVVWEYRARFFRVDARLYRNLIVAFLPAAIVGLAFSKPIKQYLFHAVPVALAFIVGGVIILLVERMPLKARVQDTRSMTWLDALKVGIAQCFALIPGTSRSGATIIGGMLFGLSRKAATEFSFFLAVPTLVAAGLYDLWKNRALLSSHDAGLFAVGSVAAFVSAFVVIRWLIRYVATHDFRPFAWYRIAFGLVVLLTAWSGAVSWSG